MKKLILILTLAAIITSCQKDEIEVQDTSFEITYRVTQVQETHLYNMEITLDDGTVQLWELLDSDNSVTVRWTTDQQAHLRVRVYGGGIYRLEILKNDKVVARDEFVRPPTWIELFYKD